MFLQVAIDEATRGSAIKTASSLCNISNIDFIEIGNPLISNYGVSSIDFFQELIPSKRLYADLKISDFPELILPFYLSKGIKRFSVLCSLNDSALLNVLKISDKFGAKVYVSTIGYPLSALEARIRAILKLGFHNIICHGSDSNLSDAFSDLQKRLYICSQVTDSRMIAAGGITPNNFSIISAYYLQGIIVGRGITRTNDPEHSVRLFKEMISNER
ncbi:MAG: orotidine 5'-phosphate decarboxylase / HUMPS family protein [Pseudomonadota bacterium]